MATKASTKSTKAGTRKATSAGPRRGRPKAPRAAMPATAAGEGSDPSEDMVREADMEVSEDMGADGGDSGNDGPSDDRLKRPALIEAVSARVSVKRSDVKMVIDVMLDELGKALDGADEVVLPPLGKLMVKKRMDKKTGGAMMTLKLKRAEPAPAAGDVAPLADPDEDS